MTAKSLPAFSFRQFLKTFFLGWQNKKFFNEVVVLAFPIFIGNMINTLLQILDQLMLSRLGVETLAAVSQVNSFYLLVGIALFGIGSTVAIFFSRLFENQEHEKMQQILAISISISLLVSFIIVVVIHFWAAYILNLYTKDPKVIEIGVVFLKQISYGTPFLGIAAIYTSLLRIVGAPYMIIVGSAIGFIINLFFNYVLIFGNWGFPNLGVVGSGIATNLARLFIVLAFVGRIHFSFPTFRLRWRFFSKAPLSLVKFIVITCFFLVLGDVSWALAMNLFTSIFGHIGNSATVTYSISMIFRQIAIMIIFSITPSVLIMMGRYIAHSSSDYSKIRDFAITCQGFGFIFSISISLLIFFTSPIILSHFYGHLPYEITNNAQIMIHALCLLLPIMTANNFFGAGIFRAGGDTKINLYLIVCFNLGISFPVAYLFYILHYSLLWIFLATFFGDMLRVVFFTLHFIKGRWIFNLQK